MSTITSLSLQDSFPRVYKDFFSSHDIVYSLPLSIRFGIPGIESKADIPYILMKLPRRCYIGLSKSETVQFGTVQCFNGEQFLQKNIIDFHPGFTAIHPQITQPYKIDLLCETDSGHSLGILGVISGLLALIPCLGIENHEKYISDNMDDILHQGQLIESSFKSQEATGDRFYIGLIKNNFGLCVYNSKLQKLSYIDNLPGNLPGCDIAVHFTGVNANIQTHQIALQAKQHHLSKFEQDLKHIQELLGINHIKGAAFNSDTHEYMYKLQTLFTTYLYQSILQPFETQYTDLLIDIGDVIKHTITLLGYKNKLLEHLDTSQHIATLPLYTGLRGGSFVSIMQSDFRYELTNIVKTLQSQGVAIVKEFCSREDTDRCGAFEIDQHVQKNLYSKRISHSDYIYLDNYGNKELGDINELMGKYPEGILVNAIDGKIYCNGVKLTSKELESQTTTAEVLTTCIKSFGKEVWNNQFPPSTMTKQYNQFLSKIYFPLKKVVKQYYNIDLELDMQGVLGRFHCTLKEQRVRIGTIYKAFG